LDDIAKYNVDRWRSLASADAIFTRPDFRLDKQTARNRLDPQGRLGDMAGKEVLCLAGGGGQQSIAFALLGARWRPVASVVVLCRRSIPVTPLDASVVD